MEVKFDEDASHRPHVDLLVVVFHAVLEDEFGRAEPPRHNIRREVVVGVNPLILHRREPEVTNTQLAFVVHQQVLRFDISVDDSGRVSVVEPSEKLIHEELLVMASDVRVQPYHIVQVSVHVIRDDVQLVEGLRISRQYDIVHLHNLE